MGKFKVVDQDNYEPAPGVILDTEDIVDRDGYRDTQTMVMEMMMAGELLEQTRRERYEYPPDSEIKIEDMELAPVVDEINVRSYVEDLQNRKIKKQDELRKKKEEEEKIAKEKEREVLKEELLKEIKNESAG